jgi:APA family basic amino acid/polyamine antiporter
LTYMGFALGIFPVFAVLSVFRLRRSCKDIYSLPGYPIVPVVYVLFGTSILVLAFFERPVESSIAVLTVLVGIPAFIIFKRYRQSLT